MATILDIDEIAALCETPGVPGYEDPIRSVVRQRLEPQVNRLRSDAMGNVVGTIEGRGDAEILIAAHMDEIGFMVSHIDDDGFLHVDALGGWDPRILRAQRVTVHADADSFTGVIGSVPPHTLKKDERSEDQEVSDVRIDLGRDTETIESLVSVGDLVTLSQTTMEIGDLITGKALDNRISVYVMIAAATRLENPPATIHFAATAQEEVGLRGAEALGVDIDPDLGIALDTTIANDLPGIDAGKRVTELGDGVGIKLKDSSVITNHKLHRQLQSMAESEDIKTQLEVMPAGGTDTGSLQRASGATPVGALSIPTRYLHTPTEAVHREDVIRTIDLLSAFLELEDGSSDYTL